MSAVFECPQCGAAVRRGRLACPECGSDAATGWQDEEEIDYRSVEIPQGWGDEQEAGGGPRRGAGRLLVGVVLVVVLVLLFTGLWRIL